MLDVTAVPRPSRYAPAVDFVHSSVPMTRIGHLRATPNVLEKLAVKPSASREVRVASKPVVPSS